MPVPAVIVPLPAKLPLTLSVPAPVKVTDPPPSRIDAAALTVPVPIWSSAVFWPEGLPRVMDPPTVN